MALTQPIAIPELTKPRLPPSSLPIPAQSYSRTSLRNVDVFSPVNQNGSFEFDRVIKSGDLSKRSRKTKQYKKFYFVLRPNLLSVYKNSSEDRLHKQIVLSDLTAVAHLKDPKGRRNHMFGLFSPSRNYHLQATSDGEAAAWVDAIRIEARIDEEEDSIILASPTAEGNVFQNLGEGMREVDEQWERERLVSSSPEPCDKMRHATTRDGVRIPGIMKAPTQELDYSGADGSYSDFSDTAPSRVYGSSAASKPVSRTIPSINTNVTIANASFPTRPPVGRNASQLSVLNTDVEDPERVIWHGYLLVLKSKGGVRQWKKLWVVLRPKNLAFYKNEEEYSAHLLIPMSSILSAVEIDPVSRSKAHCMQVIAEEKSYRLCARSEEALARCLGALKSQLAKRKDKENARKAVQ